MYLAALVPPFSLVSTYFIDILDGVGGGGLPTKHTQRKTKNTNKKSHNVEGCGFIEVGL
jgi:hypothetical protein